MNIKLVKVNHNEWVAEANKTEICKVVKSYKHGGSYHAELKNGISIYATSQPALKRMIQENA